MKKYLSILLALSMIIALAAGCGTRNAGNDTASPSPSASQDPGNDSNAEIVDGKFVKTRKITVEVYDRGNDGGTPPEDNFYTDFIKEGMLRDHNVEVEFVPVGRWTEVDEINNLLAAGTAPDICVTYSYPTIQTYANMGGVLDLAPYLEKYKDMLPNLWDLLKEENIYYDLDPEKGTLWALEARLFHNMRINTFVREDWLKSLVFLNPHQLKNLKIC